MTQAAPTAPRIATGDAELDAALGGGWQPGTLVEVSGRNVAALLQPPVVAVYGNPAELAARAAAALAPGVVVALEVGILDDNHGAAEVLAARAAETGGVLLVYHAHDAADVDLAADLAAAERMMRAEADQLMAGGAARVVEGVVGARVQAHADGRMRVWEA